MKGMNDFETKRWDATCGGPNRVWSRAKSCNNTSSCKNERRAGEGKYKIIVYTTQIIIIMYGDFFDFFFLYDKIKLVFSSRVAPDDAYTHVSRYKNNGAISEL